MVEFMNDNPLISIIIPVYNGSNYMKEAIDSALGQTYRNIEVIVVNDGSKDDGKTEEIALSYGDSIRYFRKENGGVSSALNLGIQNMRGEYFSWLSHDDKYAPEKIEQQVELLKGTKNTIALCGSARIDKNSDLIGKSQNSRFPENTIIPSKTVLQSILNHGSLNGCALLIPKEAFDVAGLFNEKFRYIQDVLMWLKIFLKDFSIIYTSAPLCYCRVHDGQLTQTGRQLFYKESKEMVESIAPDLIEASDAEYDLLYCLVRHNAIIGNRGVVYYILHLDMRQRFFKFPQKFRISLYYLYGLMRPLIRKVYYKLFLNIKTQ